MELTEPRDTTAAPKGVCQPQGLAVPSLVPKGHGVGLKEPAELLGDPVAPSLRDGGEPWNEGGLEDAVEIQAGTAIPYQLGHSLQLAKGREGIR